MILIHSVLVATQLELYTKEEGRGFQSIELLYFKEEREDIHFYTSLHQSTSDASFKLKSSKRFILAIFKESAKRTTFLLKNMVDKDICIFYLELYTFNKDHSRFLFFLRVKGIDIFPKWSTYQKKIFKL